MTTETTLPDSSATTGTAAGNDEIRPPAEVRYAAELATLAAWDAERGH